MPAKLSFFDMEASVTKPAGFFPPFPVTTGPNWQPGDIRVFCQLWFSSPSTYSGQDSAWVSIPGYTSVSTEFNTGSALAPTYRWGVSWRRLVAGDVDTFFNFIASYNLVVWSSAIFTVRGVDPGSTPAITTLQIAGPGYSPNPPATIVVSSVSVPSAGTTAIWLSSSITYGGAVAGASGVATGIPSGWTNLVATTNSGATYNPYDTSPSSIVVA